MSGGTSVPDIGLDWLLERTEWVDGCLEWRLRALAGRYPLATVRGRRWYVRRLVWRLTRGRAPPKGFDVCVCCDNPLCVHPDCLVLRTPVMRTAGVPKSMTHRIRTAIGMRRRSRHSDEVVLAIRHSEESNAVLAERYGTEKSYPRQVRSGRIRKDYASPFTGLLGGSA